MFYVYIIYSKTEDVFYKGFSEDPRKRLEEHNSNKSRFTSGKGPWELVYLESFSLKKEALIREKQIKRWNRKTIQSLIENNQGENT